MLHSVPSPKAAVGLVIMLRLYRWGEL